MSSNTLSYLPDDDAEQRRLRAFAAMSGRLREAEGGGSRGTVDLPELDVTGYAPPARPPASMSMDEFPDPEPAAPAPGGYQPPNLRAAMLDEAPSPPAGMGQQAQTRGQDLQLAPDSSDDGGNTTSPWALIADAVLNHGRGIGPILALGASGAGRDKQLEREYKRAQIEHLKRDPAGQSPEMMAYRQAMLDARIHGQTLTEKSINNVQGRAENNWDRIDNPQSQHNTTQISQAAATSDARTQADLDAQNRNIERTSENKAQIAGGERAAQIGATHDLAPVTRADAAAQAGAVAEAALPSRVAEKAAPGAAPSRIAADQQVTIPGSHIEAPDAWGLVLGNAGRTEKATQAINGAHTADKAMSDLERIAAGGPQWKPGEQATAYKLAYGRAIAGIGEIYNSGIMNKDERTHYQTIPPDLSYGTPDLMDRFNAMRGKTSNTRVEQLKGMREELRAINAERVRGWGIGLDYGDEQPSAANSPETAVEPVRRPEPAANGGGDSLAVQPGVLRGRRGDAQAAATMQSQLAQPSPAADANGPALPPGARDQPSDTTSLEDPPMIADNGDGTYDVYEPGKRPRSNVRLTPQQLEAARHPGSGWTIR
jgi:hypothetical protein